MRGDSKQWLPMLSTLELRSSSRRGGHLITVAGELDLSNSPELASALASAEAATAAVIVLDLRALEFMDSSGVIAILDARRRLGERLILVRGPRPVQRMFKLCGVSERFTFVDAPPPRVTLALAAAGSRLSSTARARELSAGTRRQRRAEQGLLASTLRELRSLRSGESTS